MLGSAWKMAKGIALHKNTQHANFVIQHMSKTTNDRCKTSL